MLQLLGDPRKRQLWDFDVYSASLSQDGLVLVTYEREGYLEELQYRYRVLDDKIKNTVLVEELIVGQGSNYIEL